MIGAWFRALIRRIRNKSDVTRLQTRCDKYAQKAIDRTKKGPIGVDPIAMILQDDPEHRDLLAYLTDFEGSFFGFLSEAYRLGVIAGHRTALRDLRKKVAQ